MKTIDALADEIVGREGGFVNDPDDPGGATKFGVTLGTLKRLGLDLTGDGRTDVNDVKALTRTRSKKIFLQNYFFEPGINNLPEPLWSSLFDMQVNAGANAVKILQRLLGDMGMAVAVDGQIGPKTIAAVKKAMELAPDHLVDAYGIARRNYYYALADKRVASRKYARRRDGGKGGWIRRAEEFIDARFHLSEEGHERRVAAWG